MASALQVTWDLAACLIIISLNRRLSRGVKLHRPCDGKTDFRNGQFCCIVYIREHFLDPRRLEARSACESRIGLDPGSGRKIPAIWHGAGANPGVFILET